MKIFLLIVAGLMALLAFRPGMSFKSQKPEDYARLGPEFDIKTTLNGRFLSEGMVYGLKGRVTSRFTAVMEGAWDGDNGTLTEAFQYDTGNDQNRRWHLEMGENGAFTATAADVIGEGRGQQMGNAVRMTYRIKLPEASGGHVLDVTDWLYLMPNGVILNRSELRKFGIKVAELVATMRPEG